MYAYMYICIYVYIMHVCMNIFICQVLMYENIYERINDFIYVCVRIYECMYLFVYVCLYANTYA